METVATHKQQRHIIECVITPEHDKRKESAEFRKSKERLADDGHYQCYVCGSKEDLQVHHYACEWSLEADVDFNKLQSFCEEWDVYGYGRLLKNVQMTSVDDIRNCMVLCQEHHTGVDETNGGTGTGVHSMSFSAWIMQKLSKDGFNPIPQDGKTSEQLITDISIKLDK
jgi:hypothetical protein